jgi:protein SCO1/2
MKLGLLRGRPVVLALFFTQCEFACPIIVHDLKRIEAALPDELRGKVDFILVSLDTERDTVAALHAYREKQSLPNNHWLLLRGTNDDVRELAALLGVNYQKDARGQFAHANLITVLNRDGEIAHQQIGLNQRPDDSVRAIVNAAAGKKMIRP